MHNVSLFGEFFLRDLGEGEKIKAEWGFWKVCGVEESEPFGVVVKVQVEWGNQVSCRLWMCGGMSSLGYAPCILYLHNNAPCLPALFQGSYPCNLI